VNFPAQQRASRHAEMEGKTFPQVQHGPLRSRIPRRAGQAFALKRAGAEGVKVIAFEAKGVHTPGAPTDDELGMGSRTFQSVLRRRLERLRDRPAQIQLGRRQHAARVVGSHGWRVCEAADGSDWENVTAALADLHRGDNLDGRPSVMYMRTRKGRGYLKYDYASHGSPHKMNSEVFCRPSSRSWKNTGSVSRATARTPRRPRAIREQMKANLRIVADVIRKDTALVDYIAGTLVELGDSVPEKIPSFKFGRIEESSRRRASLRFRELPKEIFAAREKRNRTAPLSSLSARG